MVIDVINWVAHRISDANSAYVTLQLYSVMIFRRNFNSLIVQAAAWF